MYRQVWVTNLRDFLLLSYDASGQPTVLETYRLAATESDFWKATSTPEHHAKHHGDRFTEYLQRVMLHAAPIVTPKDLAWILALYAREARARVESASLEALEQVQRALEEALGLTFQGARGARFFRSTLVQTLFYGVFSAWVLWARTRGTDPEARFNWHETAWLLRVPVIGALFEQLGTRTKLGPLGLVEVLDWAEAALNRVDRQEFFEHFDEGLAVQYFYEPFLAAFDPVLRKDLGVWFTPPEIVRYMVARVDEALRTELDIPNGLADPRVFVLDPATGTGSFLVEVLSTIEQTLRANGADALLAHELKEL
jgi:hypothetical protein